MSLNFEKSVLVYDDVDVYGHNDPFEYLKKYFFGRVFHSTDFQVEKNVTIYMCGNIRQIYDTIKNKCENCVFYVVREFSYDFDFGIEFKKILYGQVPLNIHGLGVFIPNLFGNMDKNYFHEILNEHSFSELTESNKPNNALRKGVYLSNVIDKKDQLEFHLLRCSTNFQFPTENFRDIDHEIINTLNNLSISFFNEPAELNHVLAQIYENKMVDNKIKRSSIKSHSDKTKDMPMNALMAFVTFYQDLNVKHVQRKEFDLCNKKGNTVLTKLAFHRKHGIHDNNLIEKFTLTLYPNSVFLIPLSTNRLYTHEIIPSIHDDIVRMGYVVRCSKTVASYHKDEEKMYIIDPTENKEYPMHEMTSEEFSELKGLYYMENVGHDNVFYPFFKSSMNAGDYMKPIL